MTDFRRMVKREALTVWERFKILAAVGFLLGLVIASTPLPRWAGDALMVVAGLGVAAYFAWKEWRDE